MKNNLSLAWGTVAGIGTILFLTGFYAYRKELFFNTYVYYGSLSVTILCMWLASSKLLDRSEGRFSFILKNLFLLFVVSEIIYYTWYFYLINYLDKPLLEVQKMQMIQYLADLKMKTTDIEESRQLTQSIQELETKGLPEVSVNSVLLQLGRGIIGGFVLSYLLTLVILRRR
jgi:hypothetical protein